VDQFLVARKRDPVTREWTIARNPAEAEAAAQAAQWASHAGKTGTAGLVYHLTRNVSLYYNRASNIGLSAWGRRVLSPDGVPGKIIPTPSMKGEGEDFSLALNLLSDKIHLRATYYTTDARNDAVSPPGVVTGANVRIMDALQAAGIISQQEREIRVDLGNQSLFDHESEGIELQVTTNVTKSWRLQANLARTDANETNRGLEWLAWESQNRAYLAELNTRNPGRNLYGLITSGARTIAEELDFLVNTNGGLVDFTEVAGLGKRGNRRHKVSLFSRYNFSSGWLKGAFIGGGYRHQSKMFIGLDPTLNKIYGNSYWYADAMAGYQLQELRKGRRLGFQLNVMNIFDQRDPLVTRMTPDRSSIVRYVVQSPLTWRFTTNVEF
jgi:outer membrane receptor for monomeric catechols